jgi:DNA-binding CsgD family transcriptional regulator/PAS domain-containing protein
MAASDELGLVELGLSKISADRKRERSLRAEAETALIDVQARADASISAARQAEVQAQRAQSLIDAVPGGLVTIDRAGMVLTCNDMAARVLGCAARTIAGQPLDAFLRPARNGQSGPMTESDASHESWPQIGVHRAILSHSGGDEVEIVVGLAENPEPHRVVLLWQSIDTEVRHELELLSENIGQSFRLTSGQWQSVSERLAMLREYIAGLEAERRMVSAALDGVPVAVTVVDRKGTVRYANRWAERLLEMKDGLLILQGRLAAARSADNGQLRQYLLDVSAGTENALPWAAMRIERENGMAWLVRIAPLGRIAQGTPTVPELVIVMISDPQMPMKPSTSALRQLHGLTYAEADIMGRLTVGMRIADIASELDISVETVRTHLKSVFTKTGTSRQADLVRQAVLAGIVLHDEDTSAESAAPGKPQLVTAGITTSSSKRTHR